MLQEQFSLKRPLEHTLIQKQKNFFATVMSSLQHHLHQEEIWLASLDDVAAFPKNRKKKKKSLQFPQLHHLSN